MKALKDFISESMNENQNEKMSKTFEFDFTDIEAAKDLLESFKDKENAEVKDNKIKLTVSNENKASSEIESLSSKIKEIRSEQKNFSDEQYAQKTKKLESKLSEIDEFLKEIDTNEKVEKKEETKDDENNKE